MFNERALACWWHESMSGVDLPDEHQLQLIATVSENGSARSNISHVLDLRRPPFDFVLHSLIRGASLVRVLLTLDFDNEGFPGVSVGACFHRLCDKLAPVVAQKSAFDVAWVVF